MARWVKQLTRENTLLDRSLRTVAYHTSLREIGKASISRSPIVGSGRVTSLYFDPVDKRKQQSVILREFRGKDIKGMSEAITRFLEKGYLWGKRMQHQRITRRNFSNFFDAFMEHHAHSRGAIVYGYWGEPAVTIQLRKLLRGRVKESALDITMSLLSTPRSVSGPLSALHSVVHDLQKSKEQNIKQLQLTAHGKELVDVLSWFTFFYEMGERVSGFIFDVFMKKLRELVDKQAFVELQWYDPEAIRRYMKGKKLSNAELERRKDFYILRIKKNHLEVLSGPPARALYQKEFKDDVFKDAKEFRGTVASLGRAKGKVIIVVTEADQKKMKDGDILVSPMTTPRLMEAVKMAAAIVTDEGGLTAHAAIVSRELHIPCVIGTKIATKVLRDGDMVEVDAMKGVVRKIS